MKSSTYVALTVSAALIAGVLSTTSSMGQMALGATNCNPDITICHGGSGSNVGGTGGRGEIGDSTFTFSGGGGFSFPTEEGRISGGGGEHLASTSDPEQSVTSGGNSATGGQRSVCDVDPNTGSFVCQTTGKP
jgi:hypothetical protein